MSKEKDLIHEICHLLFPKITWDRYLAVTRKLTNTEWTSALRIQLCLCYTRLHYCISLWIFTAVLWKPTTTNKEKINTPYYTKFGLNLGIYGKCGTHNASDWITLLESLFKAIFAFRFDLFALVIRSILGKFPKRNVVNQ